MTKCHVNKIWPASQVDMLPIKPLVPYARNARTHTEQQISQLAASIREWGWTNPVLVDESSGIIAGHGRILAAQKLGIKEVPVMVAKGWSETKKRAYIIADNKLALNAGWDDELLPLELGELQELGADLGLIGFDEDEIAELLNPSGIEKGLTDPDEVPAMQEDAISKTGDVWLLGKHRLLCGDCTSADDVGKCFNGIDPMLMVTDPPYGVEYDPDWRNQADRANGKPYGARAIGQVTNDDKADWTKAWALFPGDVVYCWHAAWFASEVQRSLELAGFEIRCQIVWAKSRFAISRGHYHWQHEPCWYAIKKGGTGHWAGDRSQTTVWNITHNKSDTGHGTQKPVEAMRKPIENNSNRGQAVYDPFVGSGTTIIAAEQTGRCCHAIEINPNYADVVVRRWQEFTGEKATLESTGEEFDKCQ